MKNIAWTESLVFQSIFYTLNIKVNLEKGDINYMSTEIIVAACMLMLCVIGIIDLIIDKMKRQKQQISMQQFIDTYGDAIISTLQSVVTILTIDMNKYQTKEEYEKAIVSTTIDELKKNCVMLGIDRSILDLFSTNALTEIIYNVLKGNIIEIFSKVNGSEIAAKPELFEDEVVTALASAT